MVLTTTFLSEPTTFPFGLRRAEIFLGAYKQRPFYPQVMRAVSVRLEGVVGLSWVTFAHTVPARLALRVND